MCVLEKVRESNGQVAIKFLSNSWRKVCCVNKRWRYEYYLRHFLVILVRFLLYIWFLHIIFIFKITWDIISCGYCLYTLVTSLLVSLHFSSLFVLFHNASFCSKLFLYSFAKFFKDTKIRYLLYIQCIRNYEIQLRQLSKKTLKILSWQLIKKHSK